MNISDLVPWRERRSLQRRDGENAMRPLKQEVDRLFAEFFRGLEPQIFDDEEMNAFNPALNVAETDSSFEATMELPGLSQDDIEVTLTRNTLTVTGEKRDEEEERNKNYVRRERSYGYFRRTIPLPADSVDSEKIEAEFDRGVLKITMPKLETATSQSKRITVKSR